MKFSGHVNLAEVWDEKWGKLEAIKKVKRKINRKVNAISK